MTDQFFPEHDDTPPEAGPASPRFDVPEPPHPVNWNLLTASDLEAELLELNRWVDWLRHTYGLPPASYRRTGTVIPNSSGSCPRCTCTGCAPTTRAERVRAAGLAPRLRRCPRSPSRLGSGVRHSARPGPPDSPDELAR